VRELARVNRAGKTGSVQTLLCRCGIRFLRPELVILFKARDASARDEADLVATLP